MNVSITFCTLSFLGSKLISLLVSLFDFLAFVALSSSNKFLNRRSPIRAVDFQRLRNAVPDE